MVAPATGLEDPDAPASISELKDYRSLRKNSKVYHVVLFHADWSAKSRALEMTLARLSNEHVLLSLAMNTKAYLTSLPRLSSPTVQFHLITPDSAPQTYYDLDLSTHTTSFDLPVLMLYHRGKVIGRLPKGTKEVSRDTGKKAKGAESEGEESEDEREVERKVAMERYRWDRTGVSFSPECQTKNQRRRDS